MASAGDYVFEEDYLLTSFRLTYLKITKNIRFMKKIVVLLCISLLANKLMSQCPGQAVVLNAYGQCNVSPWVLVFEDEFNQPSVNTFRWAPTLGVVRDFAFSTSKQWFKPENVQLSNGIANLLMKQENVTETYVTDWGTTPPTTQTSTFNYTSSEITSRFTYGYGKYEIRCKLPKGKGFWPAFWMFGGPGWNEIDVFEFRNKYTSGNFDADKSVKNHEMNLHYDYDGDGSSENCSVAYNGVDFSQDFHVFTVVWDNYKMDWYVDGVLKRTETKFTTIIGQQVDCNGIIPGSYILNKAYPHQEYMNIIAGTGIQNGTGKNGSEAPNASTPFPSALEVDYIRYYRKMACVGVLNVTNVNQLYLQYNSDALNTPYNIKLGSSINVSGNITIDNKQQLELRALSGVTLSPGFWAKAGSDFIARIDPSLTCSKSYVSNAEDEVPEYEEVNETQNMNIKEEETIINGSVYPNPSSEGIFHIDIITEDNVSIVVKDCLGKVISCRVIQVDNTTQIDLSNFSKGIYFISLSNGKFSETRKIIYN